MDLVKGGRERTRGGVILKRPSKGSSVFKSSISKDICLLKCVPLLNREYLFTNELDLVWNNVSIAKILNTCNSV